MVKQNGIENLRLIEDISLLFHNRIFLYGAALKGMEMKAMLHSLNIEIEAFCDSDPAKWGQIVDGKKILNLIELKNITDQDTGVVVIITSSFEKEILKMLTVCGMGERNIFTTWGVNHTIHLNIDSSLISDEYRRNYKKKYELHRSSASYYIKKTMSDLMAKYYEQTNGNIWIYQTGKTASTTIQTTMHHYGIRVIRSHILQYPDYILGGDLKKEWNLFLEDIKSKEMKIVTAVREPIARDYSAFWQGVSNGRYEVPRSLYAGFLNAGFHKAYRKYLECIQRGYDCTTDIMGIFTPINWRDEFEWYDDEMKSVLGVDIYQYPFDRERGCQIIQQDNYKILAVKVEKLKDSMEIISEFLGVPGMQLQNDNLASDKPLRWAYEELRKNVTLPQSYVDHFYKGNHKMDYFYTEAEKQEFLENWKDKIVADE